MRPFETFCVLACVMAWAGPVCGETTEPFRNLFRVAPNVPAGDTHPVLDQVHLFEIADFDGPRERVWTQQPKEKDPPPRHTGFAALVYTTGADFKAFPRRRSTWVILGIGAGAAALSHPADDDLNEELLESGAADKLFAAGKYVGSFYVQLGTATGLYIVGRYVLPKGDGPRTNRLSHLGFDMVRALVMSQTLTQGMKYAFQRDRPTGECCAFPSGHASAAFATASVLERHLGYRGAWPTFVIASYVAMSRLQDNRHFLSDVLFGSALGVASGWTVVGRHGRADYALMPMPMRGGVMIALTRVPHSGVDGED